MSIKIALAGNPNSGKTTLFNALTGANQYVGNWPGVTVEKKEGKLKKHDDVVITDLPGIYSLSPYTLEEVVARNYLIGERPNAILNIIDGSNLERNLYLTTQLTELGIPVVWNSSGYESVEALRTLEGLVQVYMPDYKYSDSALAGALSAAEDYPAVAAAAIREMFRQTGAYRMDESGLLRSGVLIRHLILPGEIGNSMGAIDFVAESFPKGSVLFSLMSQYTPMPGMEKHGHLGERVDAETNAHLVRYMRRCGIEDGYWQEPSSSTADEIPAFDGTGVC